MRTSPRAALRALSPAAGGFSDGETRAATMRTTSAASSRSEAPTTPRGCGSSRGLVYRFCGLLAPRATARRPSTACATAAAGKPCTRRWRFAIVWTSTGWGCLVSAGSAACVAWSRSLTVCIPYSIAPLPCSLTHREPAARAQDVVYTHFFDERPGRCARRRGLEPEDGEDAAASGGAGPAAREKRYWSRRNWLRDRIRTEVLLHLLHALGIVRWVQ